MNTINTLRCLVVASLLAGGTVFAQTYNTYFSGGNSSASVDGYVGAAGNGWVGAWSASATNSLTMSNTVTSGANSPLDNPGSNYLSAKVNGSSTNAANSQAYVGRVINSASFNYTQPLTLSFLFEPTTGTAGTTGLTGSELYRILGNTNSVTNATSATNMFVISSGTASAPTWQFGGSGTAQDSGMSVISGDTYSFTLTLNMQADTYTATVTDLTASASQGTSVTWTSGTIDTIGFRATGTITNFAMEFGALLATGGATTGQSMTFNVAGISVSSIPEPATTGIVLGACGLVFVGVMMWRRRRAGSRCLVC